MRSLRYLTDPDLAWIYWPPLVAGLAIALVCAVLSVFVVGKRLAFVGQGVSHAAFGGVGLGMLAVALAGVGVGTVAGSAVVQAVVLAFSIGAAVVIARLSKRDAGLEADTAIGIVLVASMAIGFLLHAEAAELAALKGLERGPGIESVLFGSIIGVGWWGAGLAWGVTMLVLTVVGLMRRQLVFWAFDEPVAPAFGVRAGAVRVVVLLLLALAIVSTMRLAGVVLATAMLVLPGATALQLSDRLLRVTWLSIVAGVASVGIGVLASMELDAQVGPVIVLVLSALFGLARLLALARKRRWDGDRM